MQISISTNNLEIVLRKLIDRLHTAGINEFSFEDDFYWHVPIENLNSLQAQPELTVGSLSDDINFLNSLIEEDYTTDFLELERLSALFRFISKELVNKEV